MSEQIDEFEDTSSSVESERGWVESLRAIFMDDDETGIVEENYN